jgi:hypothetical protein
MDIHRIKQILAQNHVEENINTIGAMKQAVQESEHEMKASYLDWLHDFHIWKIKK